ncbi:hypothetical protein DM460_15635 [Brevibacillus laterosporus]|uniref:Uncharacterized protein n=1 Tax=Brevibacillus laterosporus LMG 15441 TaxID=1042163 RepID=A0A075R4Z0_BRELA|nr:hypothetical protein BRLA_c022250 [Brevibacillus laterosporus LMG 15441]RJL09027.1 hypothetical protein DM460_15635 [Brevibacillus laterosporus]
MEKPMITVVFIINQLLQRSILDTPRYNKMRMIIHSHKLLRPVLFWRVSFFFQIYLADSQNLLLQTSKRKTRNRRGEQPYLFLLMV